MKLLETLWNVATKPTIEDLQGEFDVIVHSGVFRCFSWYYKIWKKVINTFVGYNIQNNNVTGHFSICLGKETSFDYNVSGNGKKWRGLKDEIRKVNDHFFIGKILVKNKFYGYFSLTKTKAARS